MRLVTFLTSILLAFNLYASKIPYFVSLKASEANLRTGPSVRYPVLWTYLKKDWPLEVIARFEQWRKVQDVDGEFGWVHESLLSNKRHVIINSKDDLTNGYRLPVNSSSLILKAENNVIARLLACKKSWCKVNIDGESVWIEAQSLWGIHPNEELN